MLIEGIGELKHEQELVYGNYEVLATYIDEEGYRYIALTEYMDEIPVTYSIQGCNLWQTLEYIIAPISVVDLIDMLENKLSVEEAFRKNGLAYLVGFDEDYNLQSKKISAEKLTPNMLPEPGVMFELSNDNIGTYVEKLKHCISLA